MLGLVSFAASALPLNDALNQFSIDVPAGYVRLQNTEIPTALHAFRREASAESSWAVLSMTSLGGTLSQKNKLDHGVAEAAARSGAAKTGVTVSTFEYRTATWKGFPLDVMVMRAQAADGSAVISFSAPIPLASGAIQMQLVGPAAAETKLVTEFEGVIASLKGETNWETHSDAYQLGERVGRVVGLLFVPGCCTGSGLLVAWLLFRKRHTKG
jgi:hypothetical protein